MSAWTIIANSVAESFGVENELFVRDRLGGIDEDELNGRAIEATTFSSGQEAVRIGGSGVQGNAVARFGTDEGGDDQSREAAEAFASIINGLKEVGLLEEVLAEDEFNFSALAEGAGADSARELVGNFREIEVTVQEQSDGFAVRTGGDGVGGNAVAKFGEGDVAEAEAQAFADLINAMIDVGLGDEIFL